MLAKIIRAIRLKLIPKVILICFILGIGVSAIAAEFQVETPTGFETNIIPFTTVTYAGQCPGIGFIPAKLKARFKSSTTPTAPSRKVKIINVTEGMDKDPYPYTNRKYDKGEYSEGFDFAIGKKQRTRTFSVIEGENQFKYEIRENDRIIEEDSFSARVVINDGGVVSRDRVCTDHLECQGSGKHRVCNSVRSCSCP